jgi:hypothetical protein
VKVVKAYQIDIIAAIITIHFIDSKVGSTRERII